MLSHEDFKNAQELGEYLSHQDAPIFEFSHKIAKLIFDGRNPTKAKGHGDDFWQYRNFENQEAANLIDWRISGKSDRLFVREFERQSPMQISIWCDFSEQMFYQNHNNPTKAKIATILAIALFIGFSKHHVQVKNNNKDISKSYDFAQSILKEGTNLPYNFSPIPNIIIFDGLIENAKLKDLIARAKNQRASLFFIIINDKSEIEFDFNGDLEFESFTNNSKIRINDCAKISKEYQNSINEHFKNIESLINSANFQAYKFTTSENLQTNLSQIWNNLIIFLNRV